jgi:hypothetical protein
MLPGFFNQRPHSEENLSGGKFENSLMQRRRRKRKMYRRDASCDGGLQISFRSTTPGNHPFRTNRSDNRRNVRHCLCPHGRHTDFELGHASFNESACNRHPIQSRQYHARGLFAVPQRGID